jgi:hypothetical protein
MNPVARSCGPVASAFPGLFLLAGLPPRRISEGLRAESETALAGTHEVERGFAGNCQAGGSIMSTGFGEPITPDPSQKQSRTPGTGEVQAEDKEEEEEEEEEKKKKKKEKKKKTMTRTAAVAMATTKTGQKKDSSIESKGSREIKRERERERERERGMLQVAYNPLRERRNVGRDPIIQRPRSIRHSD